MILVIDFLFMREMEAFIKVVEEHPIYKVRIIEKKYIPHSDGVEPSGAVTIDIDDPVWLMHIGMRLQTTPF